MTIRDLFNGIIYVGALTGALSGIGLFLHFAVVRPLRTFLRKEIVANLVDIKDTLEHHSNGLNELRETVHDHIANGGHVKKG